MRSGVGSSTLSLREYKKTYAQLDIEFDSYKGESFYTDKMPAQVQKLRDMGLLKIDDGASIVDLEEYGMPPCLILKKDGSTLYPTRDIAAAVYRKETYDFDKCIYVTSSAQCLHFAQWFKVVELMGYPVVRRTCSCAVRHRKHQRRKARYPYRKRHFAS